MPRFDFGQVHQNGGGGSRTISQPPPGGVAGLAQQNPANQATTLGYMIALARPVRRGKSSYRPKARPMKAKRKAKSGVRYRSAAWMAKIRKLAVKARKKK